MKKKPEKSINLILGIHSHQPIGNFDFVFEDAYARAYKPFLDVLAEFPEIKIAMHYSGIVYDWLDKTYPELVAKLAGMVQRGQVEMITGGFYEPILSVIPDQDKSGQVRKLTEFIAEKAGYHSRGLWLAERIWEPHLPKYLNQAGIEYVIIDDTHFKCAGLSEDDLFGYYVTEEDGYTVNLFPISKFLRYSIPFQDPEATIEYLARQATPRGDRIVVFADDGEKFGIWPKTHEHVYGDRWLVRFLEAIRANADWINVIHFSDAIDNLRPVGRVYLPTASYAEMMHWTLPEKPYRDYEKFEHLLTEIPNGSDNLKERYGDFVRGGFWRNFMMKYSEVNSMHKKMLRISKRLHALASQQDEEDEEGRSLLDEARDHLWAGQCNCPYWHGIFGGIYLNNIRYAVYRNLLLAEKFLDVFQHRDDQDWVNIEESDFDLDGNREILCESRNLNLYLSPSNGGHLFEIDFKSVPINLTDTLRRRKEGYHHKLAELAKAEPGKNGNDTVSIHDRVVAKEADLDRYLVYDAYDKHCLVDHFLPNNAKFIDFAKSEAKEIGDFVEGTYKGRFSRTEDGADIRLSRWGCVRYKNKKRPVKVVKQIEYRLGKPGFSVQYEITNLAELRMSFVFGSEFNLTLLAGDAPDRLYHFNGKTLSRKNRRLNSRGVVKSVSKMGLSDGWLNVKVDLELSKPAEIWRFPVETISMSEDGFERVYQNSTIFPNWRLNLDKGEKWRVRLSMSLEHGPGITTKKG